MVMEMKNLVFRSSLSIWVRAGCVELFSSGIWLAMPLMSEHEFVGVLDAAVFPLAQCMCLWRDLALSRIGRWCVLVFYGRHVERGVAGVHGDEIVKHFNRGAYIIYNDYTLYNIFSI
jgi:hypothetical protein